MDNDSKLITEAYAEVRHENEICGWCQKDHPDLYKLHNSNYTHGICKRHYILMTEDLLKRVDETLKSTPIEQKPAVYKKRSILLASLEKLRATPEEKFVADIEKITAPAAPKETVPAQ